MSIVWYFAALVVLIALSAFFSASEMSYSSANRLRLENAAEDGDRRAKTAVGILDHFDRTLSAILIGNNLVNIAASSLGSVIVILLAGEQWTWVSTVVLTLLVIIFGETMPKIVAKQNANGIALRNAYIIRALSVILYPVIWLVVGLVHLITRPLHGDAGDGDPEEAASQELQSIIETAEDEDVLDEDRSELLRSALDFSDVSASEAMTARVDMVAIDIDDDWDEIVRIINDSSYSRLPVYSGSVDNIIGFLYLNRFFKAMMDGRPDDLRAQLIPPCFVYKTTRLPDVLAKLRREQKHLAVVTDEYGGTLGVITELTLKLIPKPEMNVSLILPFADVETAIASVPKIKLANLDPQSIEFMERDIVDSSAAFTGNTIFPTVVDGKEAGAYILVTLVGDSEAELTAKMDRLGALAEQCGAYDTLVVWTDGLKKDVWAARSAFLTVIEADTKLLDEMDVVVPVDRIAEFLVYTRATGKAEGITIRNFGHAGDGNLHIYCCANDMALDEFKRRSKAVMDKCYAKCTEFGGQVSGEHAIGHAKKQYLVESAGETAFGLMQAIKQVFDPKGILNPGKVCTNVEEG